MSSNQLNEKSSRPLSPRSNIKKGKSSPKSSFGELLSSAKEKNSEGNSGDGQTQLIFKMSKKIAQLTKVIYFLNSKNENQEE
jgi:predicted RecA/RadA family phage recombinase